MKKAAIFLLAIFLAGCAKTATLSPREVYAKICPTDVQMLELTQAQMEALCGVAPQDVVQGQVYVCADSLRADEIWLLEARDEEALQRLTQAAENRLSQKAAESKTYDPVQFAVVQQSKLVVIGSFLALLVSPDAARMEKALH